MYPSGWPTCSPDPEGYGNMSIAYSLGRLRISACGLSGGGASGPTGFGAWNVPCSSHQSCQRASISAAVAAVYRCGGTSACGSVVSLIVSSPRNSYGRASGGELGAQKSPSL